MPVPSPVETWLTLPKLDKIIFPPALICEARLILPVFAKTMAPVAVIPVVL